MSHFQPPYADVYGRQPVTPVAQSIPEYATAGRVDAMHFTGIFDEIKNQLSQCKLCVVTPVHIVQSLTHVFQVQGRRRSQQSSL
jgi:hypothetical protein